MAVVALAHGETAYQDKLLGGNAVLLAHVIQQSVICDQHDRGAGPMSREDTTAEHSSKRVDIMAEQKVAAAIDNSI